MIQLQFNKIGIIENSESVKYLAIQQDDKFTGGFYIYTWNDDASGPNELNAYDDWVENIDSVNAYLNESGYTITWTEKIYTESLPNNRIHPRP